MARGKLKLFTVSIILEPWSIQHIQQAD